MNALVEKIEDHLWPEPKPLPSTLLPVASFEPELAPDALRAWIMDISERMQCPPEYAAVSAVVGAGAVVGRRLGIRPQAQTDWFEVPNLWGCIVGRPGVMKSPAMRHALGPIHRLEAKAADENSAALAVHAAEAERFKIGQSVARKAARKGERALDDLAGVQPSAPPQRRYIVNDTSYEKLGEIMADNPNGVMAHRDELIAMLKPLDREENAAARGFYLQAWNGKDGYTFDRIMRGHTHIEACCLSLLGATQPARLSVYLKDAVSGGAGDDGFAQRLGLLVWPDVSPDWRDVDRFPDADARRRANMVFDRLDAMTPEAVEAERDEFEPIPFLRFTPDALDEFRTWRCGHEERLRRGDLHDALTSHLNKYRGLVPKLALLFHLIDGGIGPVGVPSLTRALAWADYLETHAARAFASVTCARTSAARAILARLKAGELGQRLTARDVYRKGWAGLGDAREVGEALELLDAYDWLRGDDVATGGRPSTVYVVNPKGIAA